MLKLTVPFTEWFNEESQYFITVPQTTILLEHSLISVSKWEAVHKRSYFRRVPQKTPLEVMDYYRCMTLTKNVNPDVYFAIMARPELVKQIEDYINDPQSTTYFHDSAGPQKEGASGNYRTTITSDVIYAMMFENNIPLEFEKRHLNKLLTIIRVCNSRRNGPTKGSKRSKADLAKSYAALNASRRAKLGTKG